VFVGGTCGSIHVESFNRNIRALGVLESKWDPIHKKLVRRLHKEQDKVLRSYFVQKGGKRSKGGHRSNCKGREHVQWDMYARRRRARIVAKGPTLASGGSMEIGGVLFVYFFWDFIKFVRFVVN
jgi:hypothetical protein